MSPSQLIKILKTLEANNMIVNHSQISFEEISVNTEIITEHLQTQTINLNSMSELPEEEAALFQSLYDTLMQNDDSDANAAGLVETNTVTSLLVNMKNLLDNAANFIPSIPRLKQYLQILEYIFKLKGISFYFEKAKQQHYEVFAKRLIGAWHSTKDELYKTRLEQLKSDDKTPEVVKTMIDAKSKHKPICDH